MQQRPTRKTGKGQATVARGQEAGARTSGASSASGSSARSAPAKDARTKLLDVSLTLIRAKGYAATTLDDLCAAAGVTKGAFFHHFDSKEALAIAAATYWNEMTGAFFAAAPYHKHPDPLDRLLGYVDFRASILTGELHSYTCLLGTLVQETYASHPQIRAACEWGLSSHIAALLPDIEAAKRLYAPKAAWSAESLGVFIQSVLQGSFIFSKSNQSEEVARRNLAHLRSYLEFQFKPATARAAR